MPIVVDLPAPFGPSSPNTSPGSTSKSMPFTASTPPGYVFVRFRTSMTGCIASPSCSVPSPPTTGEGPPA